MRVDWCVSSWFRIKNTHSLTHESWGPPLLQTIERDDVRAALKEKERQERVLGDL